MGFLCSVSAVLLVVFVFVWFVLFVLSLPWDYPLDYVQVHNRSILWLSNLDGHAW